MRKSRNFAITGHLAIFLVACACSCANRELERRQIVKLPEIRRNVRLLDEYDARQIKIAQAQEEERRRIEEEIRDREARRIALEQQEARERRQAARELQCLKDWVSEEACQQKASHYVGENVASVGCSVVIQQLSSGTVTLKDTAMSVGADMAMRSDNGWIQLGGAFLKLYNLDKCMNG